MANKRTLFSIIGLIDFDSSLLLEVSLWSDTHPQAALRFDHHSELGRWPWTCSMVHVSMELMKMVRNILFWRPRCSDSTRRCQKSPLASAQKTKRPSSSTNVTHLRVHTNYLNEHADDGQPFPFAQTAPSYPACRSVMPTKGPFRLSSSPFPSRPSLTSQRHEFAYAPKAKRGAVVRDREIALGWAVLWMRRRVRKGTC